MAVDLVFRGGPTRLFATVGSSATGLVQLVFKNPVNLLVSGSTPTGLVQLVFTNQVNLRSSFIPTSTRLAFLDGMLEFQVSSGVTQLTPSGKGWTPPTTGQLFPRSRVRRS